MPLKLFLFLPFFGSFFSARALKGTLQGERFWLRPTKQITSEVQPQGLQLERRLFSDASRSLTNWAKRCGLQLSQGLPRSQGAEISASGKFRLNLFLPLNQIWPNPSLRVELWQGEKPVRLFWSPQREVSLPCEGFKLRWRGLELNFLPYLDFRTPPAQPLELNLKVLSERETVFSLPSSLEIRSSEQKRLPASQLSERIALPFQEAPTSSTSTGNG